MVLEQIQISGLSVPWQHYQGHDLGFILNPVAPSFPTRWHRFQYRFSDSVAKWAPENSIAYICGRELFLRHICISFVTDPRFDMVYGRRQPRMKNASFEFRRREGSSSAHEITEDVPEPPRRSKRAAGRINLPRGAMHIGDSEPDSTSR
jgi:hypothetical protein